MSDRAKNVPEGFHTLTPYIMFRDSAAAIAFYQKVFGAEEEMRDLDEEGRVRHAQLRIGDSHIMLSDGSGKFPEMGEAPDGKTSPPVPMSVFMYVDDADAVFDRALEHGATSLYPLKDQHYGRSGSLIDPFGYIWHICAAPAAA
jgi:PhnB protein